MLSIGGSWDELALLLAVPVCHTQKHMHTLRRRERESGGRGGGGECVGGRWRKLWVGGRDREWVYVCVRE